MTEAEAAIPVTQAAVEDFTERHVASLGGTIETDGDHWEVTIPDTVDTVLPTGELTVRCGDADEEATEKESLHPDSEFFQRILRDAAERCPAGKITIEAEHVDVELPSWLKAGDVEVTTTDFTPYYDRTAVVVLFQVSVETVSEYQQEFLHAVAIDRRSEESLPALAATLLELTSMTAEPTLTTAQTSIDESQVRSLLDPARDELTERIQPTIDEIRKEASRAADSEVEEYRQLQQQRLNELEEQRSALSSKIDELSEATTNADQETRVEVLKERKDAKAELADVDTELADLRDKRDRGFPAKQHEIHNRHALDVQITPLTVTQVEYERGEIDIELSEGASSQQITVGYGRGIGLTEMIPCSKCGEPLSSSNSIGTVKPSPQCQKCCSSR